MTNNKPMFTEEEVREAVQGANKDQADMVKEAEWVEEFEKLIFPILDSGIESDFSETNFGRWAKKELARMKREDKDYIKLKQFVSSQIKKAKEETIEECIKLSDKIEKSDESLNEWRGFKHFRNALRDLLNEN